MQDGNALYQALRQHTGSEHIYKHSLVAGFTYTEGVREFAQEAGGGAYWLLDILATEPAIRKAVNEDGFHLVKLDVKGTKATLSVHMDTITPPVFTREIDYTDCPEHPNQDGRTEHKDVFWKFYLTPNHVGNMQVITCMLPGEY